MLAQFVCPSEGETLGKLAVGSVVRPKLSQSAILVCGGNVSGLEAIAVW
jgi:hypothetical protein